MLSISADTIDDYPSLRGVGLFHRRSTLGQEKDLVDAFIKGNLTAAPSGQSRLIFVEPRLEIGFPDLVVVYVDTAIARGWNLERAGFTKREICVLHHLATFGTQEIHRLKSLFPEGLQSTLKKLETVGLVKSGQQGWTAKATNKLLAVRRIVAIEAKMGSWRPGLDQAFMNRWFASESYLLLPTMPKSSELSMELRASGVGLLTIDTMLNRPLVRAERRSLPGSYASWLFNEWACCATKSLPKRASAARRGSAAKPQRRRTYNRQRA